jgi:hypothetical protein
MSTDEVASTFGALMAVEARRIRVRTNDLATVRGWKKVIERWAPRWGIYILLARGVPAYVGQTRNIISRLNSHFLARPFDEALFCDGVGLQRSPIRTGLDYVGLDDAERRVIAEIGPRWNKCFVARNERVDSCGLPRDTWKAGT